MKAVGPFDSELQMFIEAPREPDPAHLAFYRFLAERDRRVCGPSSGPLASTPPPFDVEDRPGLRRVDHESHSSSSTGEG